MHPVCFENTCHTDSRRKERHRRCWRLHRRHFLFLLLLGTNLHTVNSLLHLGSNDDSYDLALMEDLQSTEFYITTTIVAKKGDDSNLDSEKALKSHESKVDSRKLTWNEAATTTEGSTTSLIPSNVIGSSSLPAKVYVKLNHNSPHIMCLTQRLRDAELTDPQYSWHGPERQSLPDTTNIVITSTGSLIIRYFKEEMAGMYTCTLHYSTAVKQYEKKVTLKFLIYAYMEPNFYYEFSVRYRSAPCQSPANMLFENKLLDMMKSLSSDYTCEVILLKAECHHIKMQRGGLQNEVFFLFSVFPLDTPSEVICSNNCASRERLEKARHVLEEFFQRQADKLDTLDRDLPDIYYVKGTLHMVGINKCFPGYGMDSKMHPECSNCCVICCPGSYNPDDGVHCVACNSSVIYGGKKCKTA